MPVGRWVDPMAATQKIYSCLNAIRVQAFKQVLEDR